METAKTKELTNFLYTSHTDKGAVRSNNEDSCGYVDSVNGHVFVVCDGCGGMPCGEKASQTVVNSLKFFFTNYYYKDPIQAIKDAIDYAQTRLLEEGRIHPECEGMATTLVLALVRYNKVYYANIGDSRIYYLSRGELRQVTKDDSYVQHLVDSGKLKPEDAESHPRKNELVQAMGLDTIEPHVYRHPLTPDDDEMVLLCTDGLYNMVPRQDILATLSRSGYIEDKGAELLRTAIDNGGYDNITFQLIKFFNINSVTAERTEQTAVVAEDANDVAEKRTPVTVAILSVLVIILGVLMYLKEAKTHASVGQGRVDFGGDEVVVCDLGAANSLDSIAGIFGVEPQSITVTSFPDGRCQVRVPVKKIHIVRFYDNLMTLEMLYGTPREKIIRANSLHGEFDIEPASEIIIPL